MIMNYDYAVNIVDSKGWDEFLKLLQDQFKEYDLYCVSMDWYYNDKYVCKAKGKYGDLIIDWEHKV